MAEFKLNNIDRNFFWELIEEGYGEYRGIEKAYLDMLAEKLSDETEIRFRVDRGVLYNESIDFTIPTSEITTYDNLLKEIEKFLSENSQENEFDVNTNKLANEWGYTFSHKENSPYKLAFIQAWLANPYTEKYMKLVGSDFENGFTARGTAVLKTVPFVPLDLSDLVQKTLYDSICEKMEKILKFNHSLRGKKDKKSVKLFVREKEYLIRDLKNETDKIWNLEFLSDGVKS